MKDISDRADRKDYTDEPCPGPSQRGVECVEGRIDGGPECKSSGMLCFICKGTGRKPRPIEPNPFDATYHDLMRDIMNNGVNKSDRTGTGTRSVFGRQLRFDLVQGFPLITTKKVHLRSITHELLWLISGSTNAGPLQANRVSIWDEWADEDGDLGPIYGKQWRSWEGADGTTVDQLAQVIDRIRTHPDCRRHIVSAWNAADIPAMALAPCHALFQFYVSDGRLSCQLYQRSADVVLGVPFNVASYSLLTMMIASVVGLEVGEFVHTFGDAHIYSNHFEQVATQLERRSFAPPTMKIKPAASIDEFTYDHFELVGYRCHPRIKAPVAV